MSVVVTCHSCGHTLQLPDEFSRRKVQCPECGVYCEVTSTSKPHGGSDRRNRSVNEVPAADPAPPSKTRARGVSEAPAPDRSPPSPPARERPAPVPGKKNSLLHCTYCGEYVRLKGRICPNCGTQVVRPSSRSKAGPTPPPVKPAPELSPPAESPSPEPPPAEYESEDGPYEVDTGAPVIECPQCQGKLPADARFCVHCGAHMETGQKAERVYEKIERQWESNMSLQRRKKILFITLAVVLPLMLTRAILDRNPLSFILAGFMFSALLAFLLGTYDRIDLKRNKRGQVQLSKTWRVCFRQQPTVKINPWQYEGIKIMREHNFKLMDLLLVMALGLMGIIPGVLWYLWVMNKATYYVTLTQHHGFPELSLYHGGSEEQMDEISQILIDATGLPCERS